MKVKKEKEKAASIGGQAVLEGVMMRGVRSMATAVRDEDGIIRLETKRIKPAKERNLFFRLPIIRGVYSFISSLAVGSKTLMRSADVFGEGEPGKFEQWLAKKLKVNLMSVVTTVAVLLGVALAMLLFVLLPQLLTSPILSYDEHPIAYNFIEGGVRISIFVIYILLVSIIKYIRRTFMYHGAEHKTITCYEKGLELTVENARGCSKIHQRCGTTFLFFVMLVGILVFSVANVAAPNPVLRFLFKLALFPVVAGLSYELLKLLAKFNSPVLFPLKAPGMLLQLLTTKQPDDDMIEVAITAFKAVMEMDADESIPEVKFVTAEKLIKIKEECLLKLKSAGIEEAAEADWILCRVLDAKRGELNENQERLVSPKNVEEIRRITGERITGRPLWYIFGDTDFYGFTIKVDESVLIPRPETEELAEFAIKTIKEGDSVLDLCTGSGAVAIAVKKKTDCFVTASDISEKALEKAKENAELNDADIAFVLSDMFENIEGKYDVIISNPPYIKSGELEGLDVSGYEPKEALDGGEDGLDFYRIIAKKAPKFLKKDGTLFLECGEGQAAEIKAFLKSFSEVEVIKDFNGKERIIRAK